MLTEIETERAVKELNRLPYLSRPYASRNWGSHFHQLLSYQSKLKPAIAHFLARFFTTAGDVVFDPFCGVGTIPFEVAALGRRTITLDISEIAYCATHAKLTPIRMETAMNHVAALERHIRSTEVPSHLRSYPDDYIVRFYHPRTLREILLAIDFFQQHPSLDFSLVKTCVLHILHGNRPYALSRTSHNVTPYAPSGEFVYKSLVQSLRQKVKRTLARSWPLGFQRGDVHFGSIFGWQPVASSLDSIITSPPFVNSTRFLYNNRIRLWFLGQPYQEQMRRSAEFLENGRIEQYEKVMDVQSSALKKGGLCVMHLGIVRGLNMGETLSMYGDRCGLETLALINEDVTEREKFGISDQGATSSHQFLVMRKVAR